MVARIRRHPVYRRTRKRLRRYSPRDRFFRRAATFVPYLGIESDHGAYVVSTSDRNIGRSLVVKRGRKEHLRLARALEILEAFGVDHGRAVILDVGANIGTTVIPALLEHGFERGLAFEPEPENFRLLRANLALNGLDERIRTHEVALSDANGEAVLNISSENSGSSWLAPARDVAGGKTVRVRTARLDDLLADTHVSPEEVGLVWMDVEGHESHVLAGCPSLLARSVPMAIEFSPHHLDRAGGLELLLEQLASSYTHVSDLGREAQAPLDATRLEPLVEQYADSFTDLLVFRAARNG